MIIAAFLSNFADLVIVQYAFGGIRVAVVALIISSIIKLWKSSVKTYIGFIIAIAAFILGAFLQVSPIYVVIGAAILGLLTKNKAGGK